MPLKMINGNKLVFAIFLLSYVLCTFLPGLLGMPYLDEILIVLLAGYTFFKIIATHHIRKIFLVTIIIFIFYLAYSWGLSEIDKRAILSDTLQQIKPFLVFFCVYQLKFRLSSSHKYVIKHVALVISILSYSIHLFYSFVNIPFYFFIHIAVYGQIMITSALLYLYASDRSKKDIVVFIIIITLGLLCGRSKYYGEFLFSLICLWKIHSPVKLSFKYFFLSVISISIILLAVWTKFNSYFVAGLDSDEMARPILYNTSIQIANDYFPFGSGFGSFAEDASRVWYSPLYDRYGISKVWGLSRDYNEFVADTFFPVIIGQFGLIGTLLFGAFWRFIVQKLNKFFTDKEHKYDYNIALIIIVIILIESVAGPMFVTTYAITPIMLLAIIMSDLQRNYNENAIPQINN